MPNYASLKDRVVIVTGGGRGLGREMALALVEQGANVVITSARESAERAAVVAEAEALGGGKILSVQADVRLWADCQRVVEETISTFGSVQCLINNAGRGMRLISETFNTVSTKFWQANAEAWQEIIDINLNGTFYMSKAVTPHLVDQKFGKIINISTSDVTMVRTGFSPYGPSKAGMEAASSVWSKDLEGTGVSVNVLLPGGASDTALLPDTADRKGADGNLLAPALMRAPALWLCADESNDVTGRRYIAKFWDDSLPLEQAIAAAMDTPAGKPAIL
jgi:3-oxoacyl-[acyl-carrier protein] reductase